MLSKVRFSLMRNTTCLIGHRVFIEPASNFAGRVEGKSGGASGLGGGAACRSTQDAAIAAATRSAATPRRRKGSRVGRRNTSGDGIGGCEKPCGPRPVGPQSTNL